MKGGLGMDGGGAVGGRASVYYFQVFMVMGALSMFGERDWGTGRRGR